MDLSHDNIIAAVKNPDWKTRATMRAIFRRSLYAFTKFVTCFNEPRNLMDVETFKEASDWLQWVVVTKKRGLLEDPRGHIKSTRVARALPEWLAIQVPDEHYDHPAEYDRAMEFLDKHHHIRGVDSRYVVACDSKERAAKFVGSSKTDWDTNPVLRYIVPETVWPNTNRIEYGAWQNQGYSLRGRKNPSLVDLYMTAVGLDSKAQGGRAEGIFIDDLVGETSYKSPAELVRRQEYVRSIPFLLENRDAVHIDGGFVIVDGNRWALDDVNSMIHNEFRDWAIWHRAAWKCIVHLAGNCGRWADNEERVCALTDDTLWKGRYPDNESLERVLSETSAEMVAAQLANDPTTASELDVEKFVDFKLLITNVEISGKIKRKWCVVIPRGLNEHAVQEEDEIIPIDALSTHCVSIDPADSKNVKNARTCISWFAHDALTGRVFWLDCRADHWKAEEATEAAYKLYTDICDKIITRPRILIEKVACQGYFGAALKFRAHQDLRGRQFFPQPEMIPPAHGLGKDDRIRRRTGNRLGQGLLYLRSGLQLPKWEVRHFPTGTKDSLDTHAQVEEIYLELTKSVNSDRLASARKRRRARRLANADSTGVSL